MWYLLVQFPSGYVGHYVQKQTKALQECGVQPLTQYSTVGATTFNLISVLVVIHIEAYDRVNQILVN